MTESRPSNIFWLPELAYFDQTVHGDFTIDESLAQTRGAGLGGFGVSPQVLHSFLDSTNSWLMAFNLAGYAVSWLDIALPPSLGFQTGEKWLRFDFRNRRIEATPRSGNEPVDPGWSRLRFEVLQHSAKGTPYGIDLTPEELNETSMLNAGHSERLTTLFNMPLDEWLDSMFQDRQNSVQVFTASANAAGSLTGDRRLVDTRLDIAFDLFSQIRAGQIVEMDIPITRAPSRSGKDFVLDHLRMIRLLYLDTFTWAMSHRLISTTETVLERAANSATLNPPGLLWLFDTSVWPAFATSMPCTVAVTQGINVVKQHLKMLATWLFKRDSKVLFSDYREPQFPTSGDPDLAPPTPDLVSKFKRVGLVNALAGVDVEALDLGEVPEMACSYWRTYPLARFIDMQVGGDHFYSYRALRRADRISEHSNKLEQDPLAKSVPTAEGVFFDMLRNVNLNRTDLPPEVFNAPAAGLSGTLRDGLEDILTASYSDTSDGPTGGAARTFAKVAQMHPLTILPMLLFNLGYFQLDLLLDDPGAQIPEAGVDAIMDEDAGVAGIIELSHTWQPGVGFRISAHSQSALGGRALQDCVAWEYIPAPQVPAGSPYAESVQGRLAAGAQSGTSDAVSADPRDRLVIVAAPGVVIEPLEWPGSVPVSIIRVQSYALVPDRGEKINLHLLETSFPLSPLDGMDPSPLSPGSTSLAEIETVFATDPELVPVITVKPLQTATHSGVRLSTTYKANNRARAVVGNAHVDIMAPKTSGTARYSYDLRYLIHRQNRVVSERTIEVSDGSSDEIERKFGGGGKRTITVSDYAEVDVLQFELIVHAAGDVTVTINDDYLGSGVADYLRWGVEYLGAEGFPGMAWMFGETTNVCEYTLLQVPYGSIMEPGAALKGLGEPGAPFGATAWTTPTDSAIRTANIEVGKTIFDVGLGFIPIVGDYADICEFGMMLTCGTDKWGRPVSNLEIGLTFGGMCLPFVGGKVLRMMAGSKAAVEGAETLAESGLEAFDRASRAEGL